jgi:flavodoxin
MKKACVVLDTRYGNTEKIATSLESGLREAGIQTALTKVNEVVIDTLNQYDLICVGGPTQYRTASEAMQTFLESLKRVDLSGRMAFAFDTRRDSFLAGSAAKYIEEVLRKRGMKIINQSLSAIIVSPEPKKGRQDFESKDEWKEWRYKSETLRDGEEKKFEQVGVQIGKVLLQASSTHD